MDTTDFPWTFGQNRGRIPMIRVVRVVVNALAWFPFGVFIILSSFCEAVSAVAADIRDSQVGRIWFWEGQRLRKLNLGMFPHLEPGTRVDVIDAEGFWVPGIVQDARALDGKALADVLTDCGKVLRNIKADDIRPAGGKKCVIKGCREAVNRFANYCDNHSPIP